ncbi:MAG TPA: glycosyltransferase [Terriglobales bacterium]
MATLQNVRPLPKVAVGRHLCSESIHLENYRAWVGDNLVDEIQELSRDLRGLRVCNVNATATGGGVAELLSRMIPIHLALGLNVDWRLIYGDKEFFTITKSFHNALQGENLTLTPEMSDIYLEHNRASADLLPDDYDVFIVHDPQPAALRHFKKRTASSKWIWRCHIDSSEPNSEVWQFLRPYIEDYDAAVFTMEAFRPSDLNMARIAFIPPAIDPVSTKNMELPDSVCQRAVAEMGVDLHRPVLAQISRFDPWKDPLGVIRAYRIVKKNIPQVQLAMIGAMAGDDPQGWEILDKINSEATDDPDLFVFTNLTGVGNMEVNAFQRSANVVLQKSIREGFGLVVAEAFWKGKPVVAGHAGGIPMQYPKGYEQYLVGSVEECAEKVLFLLNHPKEAEEFGNAGKERIRAEFLVPRLIRDELRLIRDVIR